MFKFKHRIQLSHCIGSSHIIITANAHLCATTSLCNLLPCNKYYQAKSHQKMLGRWESWWEYDLEELSRSTSKADGTLAFLFGPCILQHTYCRTAGEHYSSHATCPCVRLKWVLWCIVLVIRKRFTDSTKKWIGTVCLICCHTINSDFQYTKSPSTCWWILSTTQWQPGYRCVTVVGYQNWNANTETGTRMLSHDKHPAEQSHNACHSINNAVSALLTVRQFSSNPAGRTAVNTSPVL